MAIMISPAVAILALIALAAGHNIQPLVEQKLINTLLKSGRNLGSGRSLECFGIYLPLLNNATATYEAAYERCMWNKANANERIEGEVAVDRANVTASGNQICSGYSSCSKSESSFEFFQCNNKVATDSIALSYDIQTISKAKAQYMLLRYETINYDHTICTDTCSNAYVEETSSLYKQLDACLAGIELIPSTTTIIPVPPSTTHSSSAPPPTEAAP